MTGASGSQRAHCRVGRMRFPPGLAVIVELSQFMICGADPGNRNFMNLFGRRYTHAPKRAGSEFEASGWPMSHGRARAACSTKMPSAMTVCDRSVQDNDMQDTDDTTASWFDHPRDLLHLVNVKRAEMPRPIVGIGHSMGGAHLSVPGCNQLHRDGILTRSGT